MSFRFCGKVVCYLPTNPSNTRNSEGSFIRLRDRTIVYAYSRYGTSSADDAASVIACVKSYDEGESFGTPEPLYGDDSGDNSMCPSLMRMHNGDLGMFFLYRKSAKKAGPGEKIAGQVRFVRSADEGATWSDPVILTKQDENFVFENGHAIMLKSGRILVPAAYHPWLECGRFGPGEMAFFMSDDDGKTWFEAGERKKGVPMPWSWTGLQEPMAYECADGVIRTYARTDLGCQYESDSSDGGLTWSEPMPNRTFSSPCSPMIMKSFGRYAVAAFNPVPKYAIRHYDRDERSPLILLFSEDGGKTFGWEKVLIVDTRGHCCYPDIFDIGDGCLLIGYQALNDGVVTKLDHWHYEDFYEVSCSETEAN